METQELNVENIHPFQESHPYTVGPYEFVGLSEEGGTCSHCGRGLRYLCHVKDSQGHHFIVGTSCVAKTRDRRVGKPMEIAMKRLKREQREEKRRQEIQKRLEELKANEEAYLNEIMPSGKTRKQEMEEAELEAKRAKEAAQEKFLAKWGEIMEVLEETDGNFAASVLRGLRDYQEEPTGRGLDICCEIYAKNKGGRKGSKAYKEALLYIEEKICL